MSPRSWSSRPTKSHVATGRPKRLQVEPLEGREVPATFTVTTFADIVDPADGRLSLREAISRANTNPGADTILLKAGTYAQSLTEGDDTNTLGDFDVTDSLTIAGVGPAATVIKGSRNDRLFEAFGPIDLRFNNLTLRDAGHVFIDGGAIQATFANISLNNCVAANNNSNRGGVINAENGAVTVRNSRLFNNLGHFEGGAISVGQGSLFLDRSTVSGNLANSGGGIFSEAAAVTISRSTVALNTALFTGGGIDSEHVQVTLSNTSVRGNLADLDGGGVAAGGGIVLTNCSVTGNRSTSERGGGIAASAATARGSTFSGNSCQEFGGGIKATVINLTNCTVSGNTALEGGGISAGDLATLTNCTVSGNTALGDGGGISADSLNLINCTVSGNTAGAGPDRSGEGGGISANQGSFLNCTIVENRLVGSLTSRGAGVVSQASSTSPIFVKNTIIARNLDAFGDEQDVAGAFLSQGNNLIGETDGTASGFGAAGDLVGTVDVPIDPQLGDLAFNGGPTRTHALLAGSPAIDHGSNTGAPAFDQRGVARPRDGDGNRIAVTDIGAIER